MPKEHQELANVLDLEPNELIIEPSKLKQRLEDISNFDGKEYEVARDNLIDLMKVGADALSEMQALANQTQHARTYEVMTNLLSTMINAQREMMELKQIDSKLKEQSGEQSPTDGKTVNNNYIFTGSTAELAEIIKSKQ